MQIALLFLKNKCVNFTQINKNEKGANMKKGVKMKKICFIAPSGYGKSTAIKLLSEKYPLKNIKIASPLYFLQDEFYKFIGKSMKGEQDGELLQFLGGKIRKENPDFLLKEFEKSVDEVKNVSLLTNDDCRPPDYEFLKKLGFIFVEIKGFKHQRVDHTLSNDKSALEWQNSIPCDYVVENFENIAKYRENLFNLMEKIEVEDKYDNKI